MGDGAGPAGSVGSSFKSLNDNPPAPSGPQVVEGSPGLGSNSDLIQQQRTESGGLEDDPADNPVRNDRPLR